MESDKSTLIIVLILISTFVNWGYLNSSGNQKTEYTPDFTELLSEIHKVQTSLRHLEEQIERINDAVYVDTPPEREMDSFTFDDLSKHLKYKSVNLDEFNIVDPGNS